MSASVRSMTGFATGNGVLPGGTAFVFSIKGVNHRFLDLQFRLPQGCEALEMELRRAVREKAQRGHLTVSLELRREETGTATVQVNYMLLDRLVEAWRSAAQRLHLQGEPNLGDLLRVPGVLQTERAASPVSWTAEEWWAAVGPVAEAVLHAFDEMRRREGEELSGVLRQALGRMEAAAEDIRTLREDVRTALFTRLQARLGAMLNGQGMSEERLLQEAALLAEKSDVEEEVVRLQAHTGRCEQLLAGGGPVGKQLDFLMQELQREANTTLSKTGAAAGPQGLRLTEIGLALKAEIERAREQVQNLE